MRTSTRSRRTIPSGRKRLGAGEVARIAVHQAVAILLRILGASATLVALVGTLVGLEDLGGVGAGDTKALGAAGHVGGIARHGAGLLGSERDAGGRGRGGCDGGGLLGDGEGANGQSEEGGGVLHCGGG